MKEVNETVTYQSAVVTKDTVTIAEISRILENKTQKNINITIEYLNASGNVLKVITKDIGGDAYNLLMSSTPTFAPSKPENEYREDDLWFILDYINAGSPLLWDEKTAYVAGDIRYYGTNIYICTTAGTSGATAPTATSGTITDGTVGWTYKETLG